MAEWSSFKGELLMFSLYFDIEILDISHFGFEGGTLVLIAPVPGHCFYFALNTVQ